MKAIVYTRYGGPEVLRLKEIDRPVPGEGEVLVKVSAASMNDWDFGLVQGDFVNRMMYGLLKPKRQIPGSDIAGTVVALGPGAQRFKTGDQVYGDLSGRWGGFAEYVAVPETMLALKPAEMSFVEAAAIPQAAMLAVQALVDQDVLKPGGKLLINGAGGGVGTFAIQLARLHGMEVTAVDSGPKLEMLRSLGATSVVDYTKEDITSSAEHFDAILDVKTIRSVSDYFRILKPGGVYITVGGSLGRLAQALLLRPWFSKFKNKKLVVVVLKTNKDLDYMNVLFTAGKIKPVIDGPYKLEEVPELFRYFGKAAHKGKVVISVGD